MTPGCSYQIKQGRGAKPTENVAQIQDFQRSLSFAATRSSFDKLLVEMDQNTVESEVLKTVQKKNPLMRPVVESNIFIAGLSELD